MPSIISHIAVPIAGRLALGRPAVPARLLLLGCVASVLPDADVLLHHLGVPYDSPFGHRGASHSVIAALAIALGLSSLQARASQTRYYAGVTYLFLCAMSHALLDTCTNAGYGAVLLWPLSDERFVAPFRPIQVSPLSVRRFFGETGVRVLASEAIWVWLPCLTIGLSVRLLSRKSGKT